MSTSTPTKNSKPDIEVRYRKGGDIGEGLETKKDYEVDVDLRAIAEEGGYGATYVELMHHLHIVYGLLERFRSGIQQVTFRFPEVKE